MMFVLDGENCMVFVLNCRSWGCIGVFVVICVVVLSFGLFVVVFVVVDIVGMGVVINEVYFFGGSVGVVFKNKFVELYNLILVLVMFDGMLL